MAKRKSARRSIFFDRWIAGISDFAPAAAIGLFVIFIFSLSCGNNNLDTSKIAEGARSKWDRAGAEKEYRLLMAQLDLANTGQPYMVIDFENKALKLMLKGAVVWDCAMNFQDSDTAEISKFIRRFHGDNDRLVRPLKEKHLFEATEKTPDSVLAIVGEAVKVDPKLLQRDIPERFSLLWNDNMVIDVRADVPGRPVSSIKNALEEIRKTLHSPFGEAIIVLMMEPDDALTLYRAAERGLLTMVVPA